MWLLSQDALGAHIVEGEAMNNVVRLALTMSGFHKVRAAYPGRTIAPYLDYLLTDKARPHEAATGFYPKAGLTPDDYEVVDRP